MRDDSADVAEIEKDICIDCGAGIDKPKSVQVAPHLFMTPVSLCPRCEESWRWRGQICVPRCPYQKPLWRPIVKKEEGS